MPAYARPVHRFRRRALAMALAAAYGLAACMGADAVGPQPSDEASGAQTLQPAKKPARPGVPAGCTKEWSEAAQDSVVDCPDIPPPAPR